MAALLAGLPVQVRSLAAYPKITLPEESGASFAENALVKARAVSRATGEWALADDSGLVVPALGGRPGLHSARVAETDTERIAWLLREIRRIPEEQRQAHFVCVLVLTDEQGRMLGTWEGRAEGRILEAPRGQGGFGYDPVFLYEPAGKTFAEMTAKEKAAVSHRGQALRAFRRSLPGLLEAADGYE